MLVWISINGHAISVKIAMGTFSRLIHDSYLLPVQIDERRLSLVAIWNKTCIHGKNRCSPILKLKQKFILIRVRHLLRLFTVKIWRIAFARYITIYRKYRAVPCKSDIAVRSISSEKWPSTGFGCFVWRHDREDSRPVACTLRGFNWIEILFFLTTRPVVDESGFRRTNFGVSSSRSPLVQERPLSY